MLVRNTLILIQTTASETLSPAEFQHIEMILDAARKKHSKVKALLVYLVPSGVEFKLPLCQSLTKKVKISVGKVDADDFNLEYWRHNFSFK